MNNIYKQKELVYINKINYSLNSPSLSLIKDQNLNSYWYFNTPTPDDKIIVYSRKLNRYIFSRIVSIEGDWMIVKNNYLYLSYNGKKYLNSKLIETSGNKKWIVFSLGKGYKNSQYQLKEGEVYILNDNLNNLEDSRKLGILNINQVIGKVH